MLRTQNGFWRLQDYSGNIRLTREFCGEEFSRFRWKNISVAAFTRSGKNITRIPFVIEFEVDSSSSDSVRNKNNALDILTQIFDSDVICKIEDEYGFVNIYAFDDIDICRGLHIDREMYIEQFDIFVAVIKDFLDYFGIGRFYVCRADDLVYIEERRCPVSYLRKKYTGCAEYFYDFFKDAIRRFRRVFDCQYLYIRVIFDCEPIEDSLSILRATKYNVECMMLLYMFKNMKKNSLNFYFREKRNVNKEWNCLADCSSQCGIKSPLHIPSHDYHQTYQFPETKREWKFTHDNFNAALFLFSGCHLLRQKKFFLNGMPLHMGIVACMIPRSGDMEKCVDNFFQEKGDDIAQDISLSQIRNLRNGQEFLSVLSCSSESAFLQSLRNRSPNYSKRIAALKDATPFIASKAKKVSKVNILQFLDFDTLIKIFSYAPLKKTGYLERVIVCRETEPGLQKNEYLQEIINFCKGHGNTVNVNICIEELNKRFSYEFDEGKTIFTRQAIFKFFTTIAVKWAILSEIRKGMAVVDGDFLQIRPQALEEGCRVANAIIRERDDHLKVLTKQEKCFRAIKKSIRESMRNFFYHRDLQRRFSSYSPACLSAVITRLIEDNSIEKIHQNCLRCNKKIILYKRIRRRFPFKLREAPGRFVFKLPVDDLPDRQPGFPHVQNQG